jgi:hypothetical protein
MFEPQRYSCGLTESSDYSRIKAVDVSQSLLLAGKLFLPHPDWNYDDRLLNDKRADR